MALGPLALSHEDLWHITRGQIIDKVIAYNYGTYLQRREAAITSAYAAICQDGESHTIDELCGIWNGVRIVDEEEYKKQQLKKIRGGTHAKLE
ncbi:hypothetical protein [Cloacibacillus porcorum]|uniref:Uncharacterized protein n=1 Tax=Cloacibacillus porcorum TaxID=1197717 RepID=A0A1B2I652_9BACT|nr:hypothetical protein [Cloacibacillus porcorum]ANZ45452.1 hypothetical protein BED41_10465 [Cloacibacillus porcorum]